MKLLILLRQLRRFTWHRFPYKSKGFALVINDLSDLPNFKIGKHEICINSINRITGEITLVFQ